MDVVRVSAFAITAAVLALAIRREAPVFAVAMTACAGVVILLFVMPFLKSVVELMFEIGEKTGEKSNIGILFKITGIACITRLACDICLDAGENAMASRVAMAGRILILFYSMPIVTGLIEQINAMF